MPPPARLAHGARKRPPPSRGAGTWARAAKRPAPRQPEPETDEERARRRMEMMDDDSTDDDDSADANEIGAGRGGRVGGARTAAQEEGGSDDDDADGGGGKGEEESGLDLDGDSEDDEEEDGESGASGRSDGSGDEADQPEAAPPDWRAALADVAFEDIDKLRRDGARVQPLAKRSAQPGGEGPAKPQRANKNRPSEVTSKRPVGRLRLAHGFDAGSMKEASARRVDPRFEPLAGRLDEGAVRQKYGFVYEQARSEADELRRQLKAHRAAEALPAAKRRLARKAGTLLAPETVLELQRQADKCTSLLSAHARTERERAAKAELRAKELALVAQGKRPFFAKKSVVRDATLTKQYAELKQSGKLGAALAERRKRRAGKQRKWMPTQRHARAGAAAGAE